MNSKKDKPDNGHRDVTWEEWKAEARQLFGDDPLDWAFVCPVCGHRATVRDWRAAGASEGMIAFSCIGRSAGAKREAFGKGPRKKGPCNYAGGGLFALNPVSVAYPDGATRATFEFAK